MVDIPEYLLKRSQEAKAKAKGEAAPGDAEPPADEPAAAAEPAPAAEEKAPEPAAPEPAAPAAAEPAQPAQESVALAPAAAAPPAVAAAAEPPKVYAGVAAVGHAPRLPRLQGAGLALPAYVLIPILAIGLLLSVVRISNEQSEAAGPSLPGGAEYAAQCAACHGPDGGGGVGPALKDTHTVFPDPKEQFAWVKEVANTHSGPYGAENKGNAGKGSVPGAMPKFGGSLSDDQIWDVVIFERATFGGEDQAVSMAAAGRAAPAAGAEGGAGESK